MRKLRFYIQHLLLVFICCMVTGAILAQPSTMQKKQVIEDYYPTGVIKYRSVTKNYGLSKDGMSFKKTKVWITEYYENGNIELKQKSVEKTASMKRDQTTGEPINKLPVTKRRYYRYDRGGNLVEKGWETPRRSKNVQYDVDVYRKIVTKENQKWRFPKIKKYERERPARHPRLDFFKGGKGDDEDDEDD